MKFKQTQNNNDFLDQQKLPEHIGFIMDGNGRWAKQHGLPRKLGHRQGVKTLENILDTVFGLGIRYVSVFAFSTENSKRPPDEVEGLKTLMDENIGRLAKKFIKKGLRIMIMGDLSFFSPESAQKMRDMCKDSIGGKTGVLNFALNYGGRAEIISAVNKAVKEGKTVTEQSFASLLYTADIPDPDLIIRTGGEIRLSNFMLYQSAYSELYFSDCLWPDFNDAELYKGLEHYAKRNRRFGAVDARQ